MPVYKKVKKSDEVADGNGGNAEYSTPMYVGLCCCLLAILVVSSIALGYIVDTRNKVEDDIQLPEEALSIVSEKKVCEVQCESIFGLNRTEIRECKNRCRCCFLADKCCDFGMDTFENCVDSVNMMHSCLNMISTAFCISQQFTCVSSTVNPPSIG